MLNVGLVSYAAGAVMFALLLVALFVRWRGRLGGRLLHVTSFVCVVWAVLMAYFASRDTSGTLPLSSLGVLAGADMLRGIAFLALLWRVAVGRRQRQAPPALRYFFHGAWIGVVVATLLSHILAYVTGNGAPAQVVFIISGFVLAVAALVMVEQLYRNAPDESRWSIKFFCLAVGGVFAYDLYLFASGLLFLRLDAELWQARGAVNALAVPLIAISVARSSERATDQFVSRRMVFYSTGMLGVGLYLLIMAAGGYVVRIYGGTWGSFYQILFLSGALFLLAAVLFSGQVRAYAKVFLNKHFFVYRYDYREEWLRLTRMLSSNDDDKPLAQSAIVAIAELVDSPAGALWMRREQQHEVVATWNLTVADDAVEPVDTPLCGFLDSSEWIIDLNELRAKPEHYDGLQMPLWMASIDDRWLIVPLIAADGLLGFVLLAKSRAMRELTWEDHDLLKTVGRQVAGHLALSESGQLLAETRQFQAYNRMTAFLMHDLKNLIAQQSLVVKNAAKHKDNPEFVDDVIATVDNSVRRMNRLLDQLRRGGGAGAARIARLDVIARQVIAQNSQRKPRPELTLDADDLRVSVEPEGLVMVLGHLVRNAQEATSEDGSVKLVVGVNGNHAIIEIRDTGAGMSPEFVRERLFRPFDTTKGVKGMGIGVYQAREFMRAGGGGLEVTSAPDAGSVFRARLPLADVK